MFFICRMLSVLICIICCIQSGKSQVSEFLFFFLLPFYLSHSNLPLFDVCRNKSSSHFFDYFHFFIAFPVLLYTQTYDSNAKLLQKSFMLHRMHSIKCCLSVGLIMKSPFLSSHAQMDLLMTAVPDSVSVSGTSAVALLIYSSRTCILNKAVNGISHIYFQTLMNAGHCQTRVGVICSA